MTVTAAGFPGLITTCCFSTGAIWWTAGQCVSPGGRGGKLRVTISARSESGTFHLVVVVGRGRGVLVMSFAFRYFLAKGVHC